MRPLLLAVVLLASCFPPRTELLGKACDADHGCGEVLVCGSGNVCVEPGSLPPPGCGPPVGEVSLLPNGAFDGGTSGWSNGGGSVVLRVDQEVFNRAAPSLRVTASNPPDSFLRLVSQEVALPADGGTMLCARACVRAGSPVPRKTSVSPYEGMSPATSPSLPRRMRRSPARAAPPETGSPRPGTTGSQAPASQVAR